MLASSEAASHEVLRLKQDMEAYEELKLRTHHIPGLMEIRDRHLFGNVVNMQLLAAFRESQWVLTAPIQRHLKCHFSRVCSTQVVEDASNHQTNNGVLVKRKKLGRPQRAVGALLERRVLSRVHRYSEVQPDSSAVLRGAAAPPDFFVAKAKEQSVPFSETVGTSSKATWWSPSAERCGTPSADLELLRYAQDGDKWRQIQYAWLGAICRWQHNIIFRRRGEERWYFALGPVGESCVLGWPTKEVQVQQGGIGSSFFEPIVSEKRPSLFAVCELSPWEGCAFEWHSPAWTARESPAAQQRARVLAVRSSPTMSLARLAATSAYWNLPLSFLQALAAYKGLDVEDGSDAFAVLMLLLQDECSDLGEQELVGVATRRIVTMKGLQKTDASGFLEVEEAQEFLDNDDVKARKRDHDKNKGLATEFKEFKQRLSAKKQEMRSRPGGKPPKKRARTEKAAQMLKLPKQESITQASVKVLTPPGAHIWVARREGQWCGRLPPFRSHSRAWAKHGQRGACIAVLQALWLDHCDMHSTPIQDVPIQDLFDDQPGDGDVVATQAVAASSSRAASSQAVSR